VREGVDRSLAEGTGSQLQRGPFHAGGLPAVVERAVEVTTQGSAAGEPAGRKAALRPVRRG
jgi:glutamate---cysteine ligase / carboxylate-amine ligase